MQHGQAGTPCRCCIQSRFSLTVTPTGSPSRGGDVAVFVFDINQPSLPTPFYSVFVPISVFMSLSVFHAITGFPDFFLSRGYLHPFLDF